MKKQRKMKLKLTDEAKEVLMDSAMQMRIAIDLGLSYSTIHRYVNKAPERLATIKAIEIIKKYTGLEQSQIFTEV